MAIDTIIGLPNYNPYEVQRESLAGAERYYSDISGAGEGLIRNIETFKTTQAKEKINSILKDPPKNELGDIDYKKLGDLLLPWDRDLAMKYFDLAKQYELKMADIEAKKSIEEEKKRSKQQELTNKFDLATDEGKVAWKNQFNKIITATYQPGFKDSAAEQVILKQKDDLIQQAKDYPELLKSVGLSSEIPVEHSDMYKSLKDNLTDSDKTNDKAKSFIDAMLAQGKINESEHKELISYIVPGAAIQTAASDTESALIEVNKIIDENIGKPGTGGALDVAKAMRKVKEYTKSLVKTIGQTAVNKLNDDGQSYAESLDAQSKAAFETSETLRKTGKEEERTAKNDWLSQNANAIKRIQTVSLLRSAMKNLDDQTNQLNLKKIRLRMASDEAVNDSDIINANSFNALQQVASKFGVRITGLTKEGAAADVKSIQQIYNDIAKNLRLSNRKYADEILNSYPLNVDMEIKGAKDHDAKKYPNKDSKGRYYFLDKNGIRQYEE